MNRNLIKNGFIWGFVLWLIGYILGIVFFMFVPKSMIGWFIMPIGSVLALLVLFKKIKSKLFKDYFLVAVIWTLIAIILDYIFIVKMLKPEDGYYKFDVYLYYSLTFILPLLSGYIKQK